MAFDALLDERLAGFEASRHQSSRQTAATPGVSSVNRGTAATYGFFFLDSSSRSIAAGKPPAVKVFTPFSGVVPRPSGVEARQCPPSSSAPATEAKPAFRSCGRRQAAVDVLLALGAAIDEDASPEELRTAFRALARRYHPDSHAEASAGEKAVLARQFARLCDAYRAARN